MRGVEILGSWSVYANTWVSVREDTVRRTDGSTGTYAVVDGADISLIVPVDGDRVHLVEQYRHPVRRRSWEFPSGSADPAFDTDLSAVAARELQEETGLMAGLLRHVGTLDVSPSTLSQRCAVFIATELTAGEHDRDPAEHDMRSARFTVDEVQHMIRDGTMSDAKSVAAFALLLLSYPRPS